eukprot:860599_1
MTLYRWRSNRLVQWISADPTVAELAPVFRALRITGPDLIRDCGLGFLSKELVDTGARTALLKKVMNPIVDYWCEEIQDHVIGSEDSRSVLLRLLPDSQPQLQLIRVMYPNPAPPPTEYPLP